MYPTDRASASQARPTRELTGAAHAGIRATSSAASPAIMAIYPRLSDHRNLLAFWQRSLRQSSGELMVHRTPGLRSENLAANFDPEIESPSRDSFWPSRHFDPPILRTLRGSSHTWSYVFTRMGERHAPSTVGGSAPI